METYFNKEKRASINVASAIADEIVNGYDMGYSIELHPWSHTKRATLRGLRRSKNNPCVVSFDGGIWIEVHLLDLALYDDAYKIEREGVGPYKHLIVTHCKIRFYPRTLDGIREDVKTEETWGHKRLTDVYRIRPWSYPLVGDISELVGKYPLLADIYNEELFDDIEESLYDSIDSNHRPHEGN